MNKLFLNIDCAFIYLDDILIFWETPEQYLKDLEISINPKWWQLESKKGLFLQTNLDYFGFHISPDCISPTERKIAEIQNFPVQDACKSLPFHWNRWILL